MLVFATYLCRFAVFGARSLLLVVGSSSSELSFFRSDLHWEYLPSACMEGKLILRHIRALLLMDTGCVQSAASIRTTPPLSPEQAPNKSPSYRSGEILGLDEQLRCVSVAVGPAAWPRLCSRT